MTVAKSNSKAMSILGGTSSREKQTLNSKVTNTNLFTTKQKGNRMIKSNSFALLF